MKQKIYRTIISIEVLSSDPISGEATIEDLLYECDKGECSGLHRTVELNTELEGEVAVKEVRKHGSDPDFFMMDENGDSYDYDFNPL